MATKDRTRQKQAAKKRLKGLARKKTLTLRMRTSAQLARNKILRARDLPVHQCLITTGWREKGLSVVTLSRRQRNDRLLVATYLVDLYCLGLKDTFHVTDVAIPQYKTMLRDRFYVQERPETCSLELAHGIIYGAIDYAAQFQFAPHKDFRITQHALEARDSITMPDDIEFGRGGKPLFISGPHDNARQVIRQLEAVTGGDAGETFDVLVRVG